MLKKENSHIVLKWDWLKQNLTKEEFEQFKILASKAVVGIPVHSYYVINKDESWAPDVAAVIASNVFD